MTAPTIPLVEQPLRPLGRARATLKGRQSDEAALREVRVLIGAPACVRKSRSWQPFLVTDDDLEC